MSDRRALNKSNIASNGTAVDYGELEQEIKEQLQQIDEEETQCADEKQALSKKAKALDNAGQTI